MVRLLFVCLGNICRSPAAEAVMVHLLEKEGLGDRVFCDSAGTSGWHEGEPADERMRRHGKKRGYNLTSLSRKFIHPSDYEAFDYVLAMDESNYTNLAALDPSGRYHPKLHKMLSFGEGSVEDVPDPYYGGAEGFEQVLDLLEDACSGLLTHLRQEGKL
ncbi:MAG: low molecular weight phosphotyrosine protein phosphatase [Myxococcales bacterium]|nr:low molecular weight phosphotyrosine protein phosphatase [Myxococcales bacterium]MCB9643403.1 low molecular weight phosphotyrosine protein phosphatase [Myxococcales bacterium]